MANWLRFKTISEWSVDNADSTDCSSRCARCDQKWHDLKTQGKGDMYVHMLQLPQGSYTACQMPYEFVCDDCYLLDAIL